MHITLRSAVSAFGSSAKAKLSNVAIQGQPEDQLRAPLETLVRDIAEVCGFRRNDVQAVGETAYDLYKTRPDYSITVHNVWNGCIEIKAPGKGADPRRFRDAHDKDQWAKQKSIPNLIYTDGNEFSLWHEGVLQGEVVRLTGDIETAGANLEAPTALQILFEDFLKWNPIPPRTPKQLAKTTARLCRLMRDEVAEELAAGSPALTLLAADWRKILFPDASDKQFADGYAQAVTFGMLMAKAQGITLSDGLDRAAKQLGRTSSLIGAALRLLTDDAENQATLKLSMGTLTRVLDVVSWDDISKGDSDAWLYFYEDFLEIYDNKLRKLTGSYYTPPQVVEAMVRLVDELLQSSRFCENYGIASRNVTLADPAVGTGTFILGALRRISDTITKNEGPGAAADAINDAVSRLIAFELQLGPFAVAQLRVHAELVDLTKDSVTTPLRMYVTDTLSNPYFEEEDFISSVRPIANSRKEANVIKKNEPIMVVIGNPPYKEKAKGKGGWVESGGKNSPERPPLLDWMPPTEWGVGTHAKHLRNLYVYFWRWATWKVFDHHKDSQNGIVCFITVAGFLNGPGFQKMRDYLRRTCDEIWVIDCTPEGHQPDVNTRIFEAVQQPVCIVLASRSSKKDSERPAVVKFRSLAKGRREAKFEELGTIGLKLNGWSDAPSGWRDPFLPASIGAWSTFPPLDDFFDYNGSGVMPGRTWIIAPDADSLLSRWRRLVEAQPEQKAMLFHPHLRGGLPGDKHVDKEPGNGLFGHEERKSTVAKDSGGCVRPIRYAFRSFDRQWLIPDSRLINQPNPTLWKTYSKSQVYLTAPSDRSPTAGPALTFTSLVPDLHHYNGRGGRVFPLWRDGDAAVSNANSRLLDYLSSTYGEPVSTEQLMAYLAGVAAHAAFTARFLPDLSTPGLRIPLTAESNLFKAAADIGKSVIWIQTFGERYSSDDEGRPAGIPTLAAAPTISVAGKISGKPSEMPDKIEYDPSTNRLLIGTGYIDNVPEAVWKYQVSGKQVLLHWFSYRKKHRERPIMGDRRPPSPLGDIQSDRWLPEYTTELLNVINILGRLLELEPKQAALLERICAGKLLSVEQLESAGVIGRTSAVSESDHRVSTAQEELVLRPV